MAKAKDYFSHDYHARTELRNIQKDFGLEGVGFYWCLVEILHENGGTIKTSELEGIAYELHVSAELCSKVVNDYGKFTVKGGKISCDRVLRNLKKREEISEARRQAANERWGAPDGEDTPQEDEAPREVEAGSGGFVGAIGKRTHAEQMEWYRHWFEVRFEELTDQDEDAIYSPVWEVEGYIMNILEAISPYPKVTVSRRKISTDEYIRTIQYYCRGTKGHIEECAAVIAEVNEKAEKGIIRNKQNYLISALYQAVKANGG